MLSHILSIRTQKLCDGLVFGDRRFVAVKSKIILLLNLVQESLARTMGPVGSVATIMVKNKTFTFPLC